MKKTLDLIRLVIKYGAYIMVVVDILQYAAEKLESINQKKEQNG